MIMVSKEPHNGNSHRWIVVMRFLSIEVLMVSRDNQQISVADTAGGPSKVQANPQFYKLNPHPTNSTTDCIIHEWNNTSAESELNPLTSGIMMVL
jgi:hypothetical protein